MRAWRPSGSLILFVVLVAGVVAWIGSGMLERDSSPPKTERGTAPITVAASWSEAEPVERRLTLYGEIIPNQVVSVRAETSGQVAEVMTKQGANVKKGEPLARLSIGDRAARLQQAKSQLARAQQEFDAASQLVERKVAPPIRLDGAKADLAAAQAAVRTIEVEIERTTIESPIDAVVNRVVADVGAFVAVGGEVVEIVDNDPLVAVIQAPQHAIGRINTGGPARVSIIGGEPVKGKIRSVAPLADAQTRTFRVEVELPNPKRRIPSGVSAEVTIPTATVLAHRISPAIVSLNDQGQVGVFTIDENEYVRFHEITLVRSEANGVWVTGLPPRARLIIARPGFVQAGQRVIARDPDGERNPAKASE